MLRFRIAFTLSKAKPQAGDFVASLHSPIPLFDCYKQQYLCKHNMIACKTKHINNSAQCLTKNSRTRSQVDSRDTRKTTPRRYRSSCYEQQPRTKQSFVPEETVADKKWRVKSREGRETESELIKLRVKSGDGIWSLIRG